MPIFHFGAWQSWRIRSSNVQFCRTLVTSQAYSRSAYAYFVHSVQGITKGKTKTQTKKNVAMPDG